MQVAQVVELLKYIKAAYPRFDITEKSVEVWFEYLHGQAHEKVMSRLRKHIQSSKFEPTIHDLLQTKEEREKEVLDIEIARNKWIEEGNDPNDFHYDVS